MPFEFCIAEKINPLWNLIKNLVLIEFFNINENGWEVKNSDKIMLKFNNLDISVEIITSINLQNLEFLILIIFKDTY